MNTILSANRNFALSESRNSYYSENGNTCLAEGRNSCLAEDRNSTVAVNPTDIIFVTVARLGRPVMQLTVSGSDSFTALMEEIRMSVENLDGLLTIDIRNSSQGTKARRVMRLRRSGFGMLRAQMKGNAA